MENKTVNIDSTWKLTDVLDLEYFIHADRDQSEDALDNRDRKFFIDRIQPELKKQNLRAAPGNSLVIRLWLELRRREFKGAGGKPRYLPGERFREVYRLLRWFFIFAGAATGFLMAAAVLHYTGDQPINVAIYLGVLVFIQAVFMIILLLFLVFRKLRPKSSHLPPFYGAAINLFAGMMERVHRNVMKKARGEMDQKGLNGYPSALELLQTRRKVRETVFYLPLFILFQIFGMCFNIGVLTATLIRVAATDLAFGWQSTLNVSGPVVFRMVRLTAGPWRWLLPPGAAHPTEAQIEGSRMILKDGIYHLATQDLAAWWPFLCLCVVFYGLLPRMALFLAGVFIQKRDLLKLDFNTAECDRIMTRLTSPLVFSTGGKNENADAFSRPGGIFEEENRTHADLLKYDTQCMALIPEEIFDLCPSDELLMRFSNRFSLKGIERVKVTLDVEEDRHVFEALSQKYRKGRMPNLFLLMEAWQPPIKETLSYLRELRRVLDVHLLIYIGLIGKPGKDTIFTPAADSDFILWKRNIAGLNDPYIRPERLNP